MRTSFRTMFRLCKFIAVHRKLLFTILLIALVFLLLWLPIYSIVWKRIPSQIDEEFFLEMIGYEKMKPSLLEQTCINPQLHHYDPRMMRRFGKTAQINCKAAMKDWVYTKNGIFHISRDAIRLYGNISCDYKTIQRKGDFSVSYGPKIKPMLDGTPLKSDFFTTKCVSSSGKMYSKVHAAVVKNANVMNRLYDYHSTANNNIKNMQSDTDSLSQTLSSFSLNVFMFGFDSLSRMAWMRFLPKTRQYFLKTLGGIELENFNIVGDGTTASLLPILAGKTQDEPPESRRGFQNPQTLDNHPWVWNEFKKRGYVTAYGEDSPQTGTFQWRMLGFKNQPTDHYMRPYHLSAAPMYRKYSRFCFGSLERHVIFMNWFRDLFDAYRDFPKFFFGFHAEISHNTRNVVQEIDHDLKVFLQDLEAKGYLNSTLLILMSDHGARFDAFRATEIGRLEERLPYFAFRFPPWMHQRFPEIIKNVRTNGKRLTTPFDIYATLHDVLHYSSSSEGRLNSRSLSLFHEVPKDRTCADAEVAPHWCACLNWQHVNQSDPLVSLSVDAALQAINNHTQPWREKCALLTLFQITKARKSTDYRKALEIRNRELSSTAELYQVTFQAVPGRGLFEVTCTVFHKPRKVRVSIKDMSRINAYRSQPSCVEKKFPYLRNFCYCI